MDKSRIEPTIFLIEKISFSLKLFSGHFYGQSFIKTVRGPLTSGVWYCHSPDVIKTFIMLNSLASSLHAGYFFMLLVSSADFFSKNAISVSNSLDPDQDQHSVSADPGPNCLQRLSADGKSCC